MKKSAPLIVLALLALIATLVMLNSRQDEPMGDQTAEPGPAASRELSGRQATSASSSRDNTRAPQDGTTRSTDPSKPSGSAPLPQDLHSSLVTAELKEGETLVMGGYRKPNGSHEFILVTPRNVDIKGYEGMIQLQARIFSLEPEHLEQSGLAGLATDKRNADGKSEVWKLEERKDSLQNAGQIINPPIVSVTPGEPATVSYGMNNGGQGFSIEYTATRTPGGGFSIEALSQRNPGGNH